MNNSIEIGQQAESDTSFTKKYRQLQSHHRADVLKEPFGNGPNHNSTTKYGNMILNGDKSGSNFISKEAFRFAKQKVLDKQINKDMTIDEFRLFNNMLSSMPMCFNLFSDLRSLLLENPFSASKVVREMFKELPWIETVTYMDVEFIPVPISNYTNDKSAFDAMILTTDKNGKKGLVSIETKYTDLLGSNSSSQTEMKNDIITSKKIFNHDLCEKLIKDGYHQIHRNYLLTYAYAKKNKFKHFANVVISPKDDSLSEKEIETLQMHMLNFRDSIFKISLEDIIERGINSKVEPIDEILRRFKERYISID